MRTYCASRMWIAERAAFVQIASDGNGSGTTLRDTIVMNGRWIKMRRLWYDACNDALCPAKDVSSLLESYFTARNDEQKNEKEDKTTRTVRRNRV